MLANLGLGLLQDFKALCQPQSCGTVPLKFPQWHINSSQDTLESISKVSLSLWKWFGFKDPVCKAFFIAQYKELFETI
jgi:hypothetical protein